MSVASLLQQKPGVSGEIDGGGPSESFLDEIDGGDPSPGLYGALDGGPVATGSLIGVGDCSRRPVLRCGTSPDGMRTCGASSTGTT